MRYIALGALLGLLLVLCPELLLTAAANPLVIAFALGFALRPAITRKFHRWAT
ncbi:hypothetical protein [Streptomyces cylindrosporus]|uniref:Uncharacterized protein n=1 Tax=Streptomyces cylindrosporus TaxID=2927583 RepID=A0ABS9Y4K5_9ACTN|nr:hypothetical protein [Streptomyces cylindrosporus]MCI3272133.1 hypothetical protein [Streptomyces cylindrosporus]